MPGSAVCGQVRGSATLASVSSPAREAYRCLSHGVTARCQSDVWLGTGYPNGAEAVVLYFFICLFLGVLSLHCWVGFSLVAGSWGYS